MNREKTAKLSKPFIDLIVESSERIGAEHIFKLLEYLASLSPYQIIGEAKKDNVTLTLVQAKELSRQTREIVNLCLVDD